MAKYIITAPDGKDYEVEGEGTQEEALAHFQSTWKPAAEPRENEDYSNEGRSRPAAQKTDTPNRKLFKTLLGDSLGEPAGDIAAGLGKTVAGAARTAEDLVRGRSLFSDEPSANDLIAGKTKRSYLTQGLTDYAKESYDEAGPLATAANIAGDIAVTGKPSAAVGEAAVRALPKSAGKITKGLVGGATAGATASGLLAPSDGETRAGNMVSGAGFGAAVGGAAGAVDPAIKYVKNLFPNAERASGRAVNAFRKALGSDAQMDSVTANLQNPRKLPMTTAAASGNPGLAQIESSMRANITPRTRGRWEGTDERTSAAAWDELQGALGRSADLHPATVAQQEALKPAQRMLDKLPVKASERVFFNHELEGLKNSSLFKLDDRAKTEINRLIVNVSDKSTKLGALAQYETALSGNGAFNDAQKGAMRKLIRATLDGSSGGAWSKAHAELAAAKEVTGQASAANKMFSDFMDEGGVVRGTTGNEAPQVTSARVRNAMAKSGIENKGTLDATDKLHPDDRARLDDLVRALQQAEYPRKVPAGKGIDTGSMADSLSNLPTGSMTGRAVRTALRTVTGSRDDATLKAMETALRSPRGWEAVLKLSDKSIGADDAALLARILRGGSTAGALTADN